MDEQLHWLTLSEASRLLGVHPATLRLWADAGQVPAYRTPGGHRRFDAADLRAFLLRASSGLPQAEQPAPGDSLMINALVHTRTELQRLPPSESAWYSAFDEPGREQQRSLGRQLFQLTVQYLTRPQRRAETIETAHRLGEAYAGNSQRYQISLLDTVRAFQYFRQNLLRALTADPSTRHLDEEDLRLHEEVDALLNEVLFGLIHDYERTLLHPRGLPTEAPAL